MSTFYPINTITVAGNSTTSVTFSNIPSTFTDLLLKVSGQGVAGTNSMFVSFNGSTSNFVGGIYGLGNGNGSVTAGEVTRYAGPYNGPNLGGNIFANTDIYIAGYAGNTVKPYGVEGVGENSGGVVTTIMYAGRWNDTSAITSITITFINNNIMNAGTTFYLYGIKNS